jgi:hypothetical protein
MRANRRTRSKTRVEELWKDLGKITAEQTFGTGNRQVQGLPQR